MPPFLFGTKAETLERLQKRVGRAKVLPLFYFDVQRWQSARENLLDELEAKGWFAQNLIVRSSAQAEDRSQESLAGAFLSVGHALGREAVARAIDEVIASYDTPKPQDQVLLQPQLERAVHSGVVFSCDPSLGGPYRVLNVTSGEATDGVTAGKSRVRTHYVFQGEEARLPEILRGVGELIVELEAITACETLDVEFAMDAKGTLYLLQCRKLCGIGAVVGVETLRAVLDSIVDKIVQLNEPHPYLLGRQTLFGVMPDWNPAEIIGLKPRPLALSLYRDLVTDSVWAYQRDNYGYRSLRSFPLLVDFHGLPYIDVRVSFNSFIPKTVDARLGEKLVDYYVSCLRQAPGLHDKIEFDIAFTCYTLDLNKRLERLKRHGFSDYECEALRDSLRALTNQIIHPDTGLWRQDIAKIKKLERHIEELRNAKLPGVSEIYWLLEDCKRNGTLPFAGLARAGFIAVQMLRSLVEEKIFTPEDFTRFFESLQTISSSLCEDFHRLERDAFLRRYGHLRPGTYDILSPRYDEAPDAYFDWSTRAEKRPGVVERFELTAEKTRELERVLALHGLHYSAEDFLKFLRAAIEGREHSKFVFTRALSEALTKLEKLGADVGLTKEDLSFVDIRQVQAAYSSSEPLKDVLRRSAEAGRTRFATTRALRLPPLVSGREDVFCFELPHSHPNFITRKRVHGTVKTLEAGGAALKDAIVFIPSADPGYDWIFSRNIRGLVTMFGGANSHMAIRAGELGIAAVIGAGEGLYTRWSQSEVLELDCENQCVWEIR